jgi:hypothetical protein
MITHKCDRCHIPEIELIPMGDQEPGSHGIVSNHELIRLERDYDLPDNIRISLGFGRESRLNYYFCDQCKIELLALALNKRFGVLLITVEEG